MTYLRVWPLPLDALSCNTIFTLLSVSAVRVFIIIIAILGTRRTGLVGSKAIRGHYPGPEMRDYHCIPLYVDAKVTYFYKFICRRLSVSLFATATPENIGLCNCAYHRRVWEILAPRPALV